MNDIEHDLGLQKRRVIMHFDIDAFFAEVEVLKNPLLKGKPVIVGGHDRRGVVSTANYEARKYGIHSAMSIAMARQLCPHGQFVRGSFDLYSEYSRRVFSIIRTGVGSQCPIEKVGIDEGYIDISNYFSQIEIYGVPLCLDDVNWSLLACELAKKLKLQVKEETGLTISIGIAENKFLAKLASDWKKPDGLFVIAPQYVRRLLDPLPIIKVHGLGKKSVQKLNAVGLYTISDLMGIDVQTLGYFLGESWASEIYDRIRGIDNRPLITTYERKSYGRETTFDEDVIDTDYILNILSDYLEELLDQLMHKQMLTRTITLKIKFDNFSQFTRSHSFEVGTNERTLLYMALSDLLHQALDQNITPIRLAGVTLSNLSADQDQQLSLFDGLL